MDNKAVTLVRRLMREMGLSHEKIAKAAGIDRTTVGRLESGERLPGIRYLYGLAKALDIPFSEVVRRAEDRVK